MPLSGWKLQRRSFEDPKMNPQPLATWQVSVPTFTPPACAGAAMNAADAKSAAPSVNANFFDMMFALLMVFRLNAAHDHRPARVRLGAADKTRALKRRFLVCGLRGR